MISWNDFYNKKITQDMDLYPTVWEVKGKDSKGAINNELIVAQVNLQSDEKVVNMYFREPYWEPQFTAEVTLTTYNPNNKKFDTNGVEKIPVSIYSKYEIDDSGNSILNPIETKETDDNGQAVFNFNGILTITKEMKEGSNASTNEHFIFHITNNVAKETMSISLAAGETVTLKLPLGQYTVQEESQWAWRYGASYIVKDYQSPDGDLNRNTIYLSTENLSEGSASVICTNTKNNNQWFDSNSNKENEFTAQ